MNVLAHQQFFTSIPVSHKKAKIKQNGQTFFQGQTSNKKAKIKLFGHKKAKLSTLISVGFRELQLVPLPRISTFDRHSNLVTLKQTAMCCV